MVSARRMGYLGSVVAVVLVAESLGIALPAFGRDLDPIAPLSPSPMPSSPISQLQPVPLSLPDLITLVIEGNRDLRNSLLERIVQRQQLVEAERRFEPDLTPQLSLLVRQRLDDAEGILADQDRTTTDEQAQLIAQTLTPLGTRLELAIDPLAEQPLQFTLRQPLLRGFGPRLNRAPITQARLTEERYQLELQQQTMLTITEAITGYTQLIQQQEAVRIQVQALERRREQYTIIAALVEAGRRPRIDLMDAEGNIANAERDLQNARSQLSQANTDVLNLIGSDDPIQFVASLEEVEQWFTDALQQVPSLDVATLLATAYEERPDYRSAELAIAVEQIAVDLANDNQRWQLDITGNGRLGENADASVGLVLTRRFGDEQGDTAQRRSQVDLLQQENRLAQLTTGIRNEVTNRLEDIRSSQRRVEAARRATAAAQVQLEGDREKFRRGRGGVTLLDLSQREEALVNAQNAQLEAEIALLNSLALLDQAIGLTLRTWESQVDFAPLFTVPTLP